MDMDDILENLVMGTDGLRFGPPVSHVYNPLVYAGDSHARYVRRYGRPPKEVLLLGMNPGPWGMAQTGVPFGEVAAVRDWLGIETAVGSPERIHPKRPVEGFACKKSEVSGRRLWGWVKRRFRTPERFFDRFFVANYCPLMFIEASGRNRTPDRLPKAEKTPLVAWCDRALRDMVRLLQARLVVGVGRFAAKRATLALADMGVDVGMMTHPSPANPKANRGWVDRVEVELADLGITLP
jgi:single-strand selective monofunctional uracil DNA glycosylase